LGGERLRGSPRRERLYGRQTDERTWEAGNLKRARGPDLGLNLQGGIKGYGFLNRRKPLKLR